MILGNLAAGLLPKTPQMHRFSCVVCHESSGGCCPMHSVKPHRPWDSATLPGRRHVDPVQRTPAMRRDAPREPQVGGGNCGHTSAGGHRHNNVLDAARRGANAAYTRMRETTTTPRFCSPSQNTSTRGKHEPLPWFGVLLRMVPNKIPSRETHYIRCRPSRSPTVNI